MTENSVWLNYKSKRFLIQLLLKYQSQYHFFQFTNCDFLSYFSKNVTCDFLSYVQLGYTITWAVWFALISRASFIKEHKAFESLKDWESIRFFILLFLLKLSKFKISNFLPTSLYVGQMNRKWISSSIKFLQYLQKHWHK